MITLESSRQATMASQAARRDAYLKSREEEKEKRKRDALRKIAPGFEPHGATLVPTRIEKPTTGEPVPALASSLGSRPRSVMDDLVDQLAALDAASSKPSS